MAHGIDFIFNSLRYWKPMQLSQDEVSKTVPLDNKKRETL